MENIYYILGSVYALLGIIFIVFERKSSKKIEVVFNKSQPNNEFANFKRLEQKEPSNKPPLVLSVILVVISFLLLIFSIIAISLWISGSATFKFDISIVIFAIFFIILPVVTIIDIFFIDKKRFKIGKSTVAKEASVSFDFDINEAFDRCKNALTSIQANIILIDKPKLIKATIEKSKFTISLRRIRGGSSKANIICDSQWLTVIFDMGKNRKYLNQFLKALK